jgi:hypothetical protein
MSSLSLICAINESRDPGVGSGGAVGEGAGDAVGEGEGEGGGVGEGVGSGEGEAVFITIETVLCAAHETSASAKASIKNRSFAFLTKTIPRMLL